MWGAAGLTLALLAASASALASSGGLSGELTFHTLALEGAATLTSPAAALDLRQAAVTHPVRLAWSAAKGELVERDWTRARGPLPIEYAHSLHAQPLRFRTASIEIRDCEPGICQVLLVANGGGRVGLQGTLAGDTSWTTAAEGFCSGVCAGDATHTFYHEAPAGSFAAADGSTHSATTPVAREQLVAQGDLVLFVMGAKLHVSTGDDDVRVIDTTRERRPVAGSAIETVRTRHVELHLQAVYALEAEALGARLLADEVDIALDGMLSSPEATGTLRWEGRSRALASEPLSIVGAIDLTLARRSATHVDGTALALGEGRASFDGNPEAIRIGGLPWTPPISTTVQTGGTALGIAGILLLFARAILGMFYSRIGPADLLLNANRRAVYEALQQGEALTVADVSLRTGIPRVVAHHHVRMLETHALVRTVKVGRVRLLRATGSRTSPETSLILRDPTRHAVAAALAALGEATRGEVARRTHLSPRLVGYHLAKLAEAGLAAPVPGRQGRYRSLDPRHPQDALTSAPSR